MKVAKYLWSSALSLPSTLLHWWRKDYQDSRIIFEQNGYPEISAHHEQWEKFLNEMFL
jgi:hypothetical protein